MKNKYKSIDFYSIAGKIYSDIIVYKNKKT